MSRATRSIALATVFALALVVAASTASCSDEETGGSPDAGAGGAPNCGDSPGAKCCTTDPKCQAGLACNAANVCEGCGYPDELCCNGTCSSADHGCYQGRCAPCGLRGQPCCDGVCTGQRPKCCGESTDPHVCEPSSGDALCKVCCATCIDGTSTSVDVGDAGCAAAAQAACATVVCPDGGTCPQLSDWGWKTGCQ